MVNVTACLQLACHMYRQGKDPGGMLIQESGFAIFGKLVRVCTTTVHDPISSHLRYRHLHSRLHQKWAVDRDKRC